MVGECAALLSDEQLKNQSTPEKFGELLGALSFLRPLG